jgi:hypothetical protein
MVQNPSAAPYPGPKGSATEDAVAVTGGGFAPASLPEPSQNMPLPPAVSVDQYGGGGEFDLPSFDASLDWDRFLFGDELGRNWSLDMPEWPLDGGNWDPS